MAALHNIFGCEGATNVTWVWCSNIASARTTPLRKVFLGDAYVSWTCMHGYNHGGTQLTVHK